MSSDLLAEEPAKSGNGNVVWNAKVSHLFGLIEV